MNEIDQSRYGLEDPVIGRDFLMYCAFLFILR